MIGAARCGTTSLWRALDGHPQIRVPSDKEREFFSSDERYGQGPERYVRRTFPEVRDDEVIGTVTPQLMPPDPGTLQTVVGRINETCPDVRIIAMLRDPIERGISQFRRMKKVTSGGDENFDAFIGRLAEKRGGIGKVPLVRAGDYGRILTAYGEVFGKDRIKVFFTRDLDVNPQQVYREVFTHLGVDPDHDPGAPRVHLGGMKRRVSPEALQELVDEVDRLGLFPADDDNVRRGFAWWLRHLWNTEPDDQGVDVSPDLRRTLAKRYLRDAELLEKQIGVAPPWTNSLRAAL